MMNAAWNPSGELADLLEALCHNRITTDEAARLEQLVLADSNARRYYVRYLHLHASLPHILRPEPTERRGEHGTVDDDLFPVQAGVRHADPVTLPPIIIQSLPMPRSPFSAFVGSALFSYLMAAVIVGVGLTTAAVWKLSERPQIATQESPSVPGVSPLSPLPSAIARITGMVDCVWEGTGGRGQGTGDREQGADSGQWPVASGQKPSSRQPPSTNHYPLTTVSLGDTLALKSGLLELTYDTGAKVILQGPVTYKVDSVAGGYLSVGKLTAKLEKRGEGRGKRGEKLASNVSPAGYRSLSTLHSPLSTASNPQSLIPNPSLSPVPCPLFSIKTPTAVVTDLGTEFGVEVDEYGTTTSSVFRGLIELQTIGNARSPQQTVRLAKDESARVEASPDQQETHIRRVSCDPSAFVRSDQFSKATRENDLKHFRRWQAYSERIRRDPALVVYYDFQRRADSPQTLHAMTRTDHADSCNGVIEEAVWTVGRMAGKDALCFGGCKACVRVRLPQKNRQMTLAAWVSVEFIDDHKVCGLLMSDKWESSPGEKWHWQIGRDGRIHLGTKSFGGPTNESVFPWQMWGSRKWHHLAAVVDSAIPRAMCYVDGKGSVFDGGSSKGFDVAFGEAMIGNWLSDSNHKERGLRGRMDELLILSRAMTDQEINQLFEAGKP